MMSEMIAQGLRGGGIEVVGVAATARAALAALAAYTQHRPDVVTCDLRLADQVSGIELVAQLVYLDPDARAIIFSGQGDEASIQANLDAGAVGYVLKTVTATELIECVRQAAEGQTVFDRVTAAKVINALRKERSTRTLDTVHLSPREQEVLALLSRGVTSTRAIAAALYVSNDTAKTHCERILAKLGVNDRAAAVAKAFRDGLVSLDDPAPGTGGAGSR